MKRHSRSPAKAGVQSAGAAAEGWVSACAGTHSPDGERGFTLIELMVALLIFAMIAAAGVSLLSFGVRAQAAAKTRLDASASVRRMSMLMANDLAQAVPRLSRDSNGQQLRAFTGNDGRSDPLVLGYVRAGWTNPDGLVRSSVQRVDVTLVAGTLTRQGYAATDGTAAGPGTVLADQVTALALRYRDRKGEWHPRWDNVALDSLPVAVEMSVTRTGEAPLTFLWLTGPSYP